MAGTRFCKPLRARSFCEPNRVLAMAPNIYVPGWCTPAGGRRDPTFRGMPWPCQRNGPPPEPHESRRSEEHTSELQSLMRISYAVFCLKKKKQTKKHHSQ